jgi:TonB family protein
MAVANHLKLSADSLGKIGDRPDRRVGAYDPPEMATKGPSPAGDVWSIAATLLAVLTQNEPSAKNGKPKSIAIPKTIPQPFLEIARECLRDEAQRCTAEDILRRLQPPVTVVAREPAEGKVSPAQEGSKRWIVLTIVAAALVLGVWLGIRILSRQTPVPAADSRNAAQSAPADVPAEQTPAPFSRKQSSAQNAVTRGSVVQQVLPEVSRSAQNTITGRVKVSVQVSVDASGNVSQAKLVSAGPSRYFADRALEAARRWKFAPPQVDGTAAASEWLLRFQIGRASIQVFPTETKP